MRCGFVLLALALTLLVLVLFFVLLVTHGRESAFEVDLVLRRRQISEIGQGLDPELTCRSLIGVGLQRVLLADRHYLVAVILLYVVVEQLLLKS